MKTNFYTSAFGALIFGYYFWSCILTPTEWHFIDGVNLIFHEAGHIIFIFFPDIIAALMGSVFQLLVPATFVVYFYGKGELLSANLLLLWFAQNLMSVSIYVRDAIPMNLDLLGGDSSTHDWNFILGEVGLLHQSISIANGLALLSYIIMTLASVLIIHQFQILYKNYQI